MARPGDHRRPLAAARRTRLHRDRRRLRPATWPIRTADQPSTDEAVPHTCHTWRARAAHPRPHPAGKVARHGRVADDSSGDSNSSSQRQTSAVTSSQARSRVIRQLGVCPASSEPGSSLTKIARCSRRAGSITPGMPTIRRPALDFGCPSRSSPVKAAPLRSAAGPASAPPGPHSRRHRDPGAHQRVRGRCASVLPQFRSHGPPMTRHGRAPLVFTPTRRPDPGQWEIASVQARSTIKDGPVFSGPKSGQGSLTGGLRPLPRVGVLLELRDLAVGNVQHMSDLRVEGLPGR